MSKTLVCDVPNPVIIDILGSHYILQLDKLQPLILVPAGEYFSSVTSDSGSLGSKSEVISAESICSKITLTKRRVWLTCLEFPAGNAARGCKQGDDIVCTLSRSILVQT